MAFSDPQSLTIGGTATSLPRVFSGGFEGQFATADSSTKLRISHAIGKRYRRLLRVDSQKIISDPLNPNINVPTSMSVSLIVDVPKMGYSVADQKAIVDALTAYLAASSGANVTKFLGGES